MSISPTTPEINRCATLAERHAARVAAERAWVASLLGDPPPLANFTLLVNTFNAAAWAIRADAGMPARRPALSVTAARRQQIGRRLVRRLHRYAPWIVPELLELLAEPLGAMMAETRGDAHGK